MSSKKLETIVEREQLKSDSNSGHQPRKEKELNSNMYRWTVNKSLISQFVYEVLFTVVYFAVSEVRVDACEQCHTWQGASDPVPWALIYLGYQPIQRADRPTKHHTCRLPCMYDPPCTTGFHTWQLTIATCPLSSEPINVTSFVVVYFFTLNTLHYQCFIFSLKRRTTWSSAPPHPRASVVQGYTVLVALPVWELSTLSVSTPDCNFVNNNSFWWFMRNSRSFSTI